MKNHKQGAGKVIFRTVVGLVAVAAAISAIAGALASIGWLSTQLGGPSPNEVLPFSLQGATDLPGVLAGYVAAGTLALCLLMMAAVAVAALVSAGNVLGGFILEPRSDDTAADDELRKALMLVDDVAPLPAPAHAALVTLRARLAAAQGVSVEQLVAKAVRP